MEKLRGRRGWIAIVAAGIVLAMGLGACTSSKANTTPTSAAATAAYKPQTRNFTVTIVPLLVHEETGLYDYLNADFAKHGVLHDKEVWGFYPSSIVVFQGDRVNITVYNPGDDPHTFTMTDLGKNRDLAARSVSKLSFTAKQVGAFGFACDIPEHDPFMNGELVVLPGSSAA